MDSRTIIIIAAVAALVIAAGVSWSENRRSEREFLAGCDDYRELLASGSTTRSRVSMEADVARCERNGR